jgi:glucokinase
LVRSGGATIPLVTEGGHVDFAPTTEQEVAILRWLLKRYERVSAERLVSGMGIQNIYQALAELRGSPVERISPAEISRLAFEERDQFALETLEQFCKIYGSVAGNLALSYGAQGGVFVTGGIVPKMLDFFIESGFRQRFEAKGRFDQYMASIPTYVMTAEEPGLIGAAAALV